MVLFDGFMLGFVATASLVAAMFFLRFWYRTHDFLFFAFAVAFLFQAATSLASVFLRKPDGVSPWLYIGQLCTYLLILAAILRKNRRAR
jgi:hypothetical protein